GHGAYGIVGKHVANESLFIYIATALWAVALERARDDGNQVPIDTEAFVDGGMTLKPAPYECKITNASEELLKT
ncbi:hypothetical protein EDB92DRAFT_1857503, partial [Lactarius akahatsu]